MVKTYTDLRPAPNMTLDFTGLSGEDWSQIRGGIERASGYTFQELLLFGQRPGPAIQSAVLNLDEDFGRCLDLYTASHLQRWEAVLLTAQEVLDAIVRRDPDELKG